MGTPRIAEMERNNRSVMLCHTIEVIAITGTFMVQAAAGRRTWGYFLIVALLTIAPAIAERSEEHTSELQSPANEN